MRTAILLKRTDERLFQCVVKISADIDFRTFIERVLGGKGRTPKDDPVLFDPELDLHQYDTTTLGQFDLDTVCDLLNGSWRCDQKQGPESR